MRSLWEFLPKGFVSWDCKIGTGAFDIPSLFWLFMNRLIFFIDQEGLTVKAYAIMIEPDVWNLAVD